MEKDKKKGSLKIIIAVIIALVVLAGIVICVIMQGKNSSSKKSNKNVKEADTPQEEAIVILFNAINSYDRDTINELCDPTGDNPTIESGMSTAAVYMHNFRFYKSIIEIDDRVRTDQEIMDLYYESYGFSPFREGGPEEYREVSQDNKKYEKKFDDFKADYELVSMKKADEYTVSLRNRLDYEEIDLQEYIGDKYDIEVGDVYGEGQLRVSYLVIYLDAALDGPARRDGGRVRKQGGKLRLQRIYGFHVEVAVRKFAVELDGTAFPDGEVLVGDAER